MTASHVRDPRFRKLSFQFNCQCLVVGPLTIIHRTSNHVPVQTPLSASNRLHSCRDEHNYEITKQPAMRVIRNVGMDNEPSWDHCRRSSTPWTDFSALPSVYCTGNSYQQQHFSRLSTGILCESKTKFHPGRCFPMPLLRQHTSKQNTQSIRS